MILLIPLTLSKSPWNHGHFPNHPPSMIQQSPSRGRERKGAYWMIKYHVSLYNVLMRGKALSLFPLIQKTCATDICENIFSQKYFLKKSITGLLPKKTPQNVLWFSCTKDQFICNLFLNVLADSHRILEYRCWYIFYERFSWSVHDLLAPNKRNVDCDWENL